jgi:hypothetical protein
MHLTVYYSRRQMPGVAPFSERVAVRVPASETRFMVMAPGGENPRPDLQPAARKVGIRVRRNTHAMAAILSFRSRLLAGETSAVLGTRKPSDHRRNAFGSKHFQPHMTFLLPGNGIDRDLTKIGNAFRNAFNTLTFDRFIVDVVTPSLESAPTECPETTATRFGNSMRWVRGRGLHGSR